MHISIYAILFSRPSDGSGRCLVANPSVLISIRADAHGRIDLQNTSFAFSGASLARCFVSVHVLFLAGGVRCCGCLARK